MKKKRKEPSLEEQMVADTGLPVPGPGASHEDCERWKVACVFMFAIRKHGVTEGKQLAYEFLRSGNDCERNGAYIEQAMGVHG